MRDYKTNKDRVKSFHDGAANLLNKIENLNQKELKERGNFSNSLKINPIEKIVNPSNKLKNEIIKSLLKGDRESYVDKQSLLSNEVDKKDLDKNQK